MLRNDVSKSLVAEGYKRNGRLHQLRYDDDFAFWVDTGLLGKRTDIAPFVGIRHEPTQRLRAELRRSQDDRWVGTVGANVGYVLGIGYRSWEQPAVASDVMPVLHSAVDRLRAFLNVETLPNAWDIEGAKAPCWQYNYIFALVLKNDAKAVEDAMATARSQLCRKENEICHEFREFEARLRERSRLGA
jgi:hypothetical protein